MTLSSAAGLRPRGAAAISVVVLLAIAALSPSQAAARTRAATHIVQLAPGISQAAGARAVRDAGGSPGKRLRLIHGLGARLGAGAAARLAADPRVRAVTANAGVAPQATDTIAVPDDQAASAESAAAAADGAVAADAAATGETPTPNSAAAAVADATDAGTTSVDTTAGDASATSVDPTSADAGAELGQLDPARLATSYPASVFAPQAWAAGFTGQGVTVAVIDTGIAGQLADFRGAGGGSRVVASAVVNPGATSATDTYGHGTHVAGIVAGDGSHRAATDPQAGQYVGVAPGANLVSIKIADDAGTATILDAIYGLQFAVDHAADYGIRIVNLSLESTVAESAATDPLDAAVEAAWLHGLVVVAAAGNRGSNADAGDYAPGNDPYAITVGAVDDQGTEYRADDALASWSSRGTTQDGVAKPDVTAPGAHIVSTLAPGSDYTTLCPSCVVGDGYMRAGGTSMAAPVVSGLAALLLQAHPEWSPNEVKAALTISAGALSTVDEANAIGVFFAYWQPPPANGGLQPNELVDPATGDIDYARSSWSRSSWSSAPDELTALWARSSWSCACGSGDATSVDPARSSWSRSSWSTRWGY